MPPHSLATVLLAYRELSKDSGRERLHENIGVFKEEVTRLGLDFIESDSAIHCCVVPGNVRVINMAMELQKQGFGVRGILYPTVPMGRERLRFCLHSHNSRAEIVSMLGLLAKLM
jgi:8-amino-7-oxononanoate synthase